VDYEAMELLRAAGVRAGVCQRAGDRRLRDPQLAARDWWQTMTHEELGDCEFDGVLPKLSRTPGTLRKSSPLFGEHTHEVMRDVLGMSDDELVEHEAMGVFM
jgi:formyl-CoA transferase